MADDDKSASSATDDFENLEMEEAANFNAETSINFFKDMLDACDDDFKE